MIKLDACGLSCPEPLLMLKKAIKNNKEGEDIQLILSSQNALANCQKYAVSNGYTVDISEVDGNYSLQITKG